MGIQDIKLSDYVEKLVSVLVVLNLLTSSDSPKLFREMNLFPLSRLATVLHLAHNNVHIEKACKSTMCNKILYLNTMPYI